MPKHPYILALFFLGLIGILIATKQIQVPKIFSPKASVIGVSLSLLPSTNTLEPGAESVFDIVLNADGESVSAIELILNYDSSVIQVTDIKPTEALPQTLALDVAKPGRASVILLVSPNSSKQPDGVVGKVYLKTLKAGTTSLKFDPTTKVSAIGKTGDVTGAVESAEIIVSGAENVAPTVTKQPVDNTDTAADDLIKTYLNFKAPDQIASESGGILNHYSQNVSKYFQNMIKNINSSVEKEAGKFLN